MPPPLLPRAVTVHVQLQPELARPPRRSGVTCYRCGETGHYRVHCKTFRTTLCPDGALCTKADCSMAHHASELRRPFLFKCVRVYRENGVVRVLGCGRYGHTYMNCPEHASF